MITKYWSFVAGFFMGNFIYQIITMEYDWVTAFERGYFQLFMAVTIYFFVLRKANGGANNLRPKIKESK